MSGTPPADIDVSIDLARQLLSEQHPDLAGLEITEAASGWDNVMYRLGDALAIRIPRRKYFAHSLQLEQDYLPKLKLTLPTPIPTHIGKPTENFPYPWSVVPWLPGKTADLAPPIPSEANTLANFLKNFHQLAPPDAPRNSFRGVPLASVQTGRIGAKSPLEPTLSPHLLKLWNRALSAPPSQKTTWLHGDLHTQNILTQDGKFSAILDWGDICKGDPATDLCSFYMLFKDPTAIHHYTQDPDLIARAQGWAIHLGTILYQSGLVDDPRHAASGRQTLKNLELAPLMP